MLDLFLKLCNWISTFEISYKGGAVFIDIAVWIIVLTLVIAIMLGYDITLIKR